MKILGPILLSALATIAACSDASEMGPNDERADEMAGDAVPLLAEQYGAVVSTTMKLCKTDTSPCPADDAIEVTGTLRGLMSVTQNESEVHGSLTACNVQLKWNEDDYDSKDYLDIKTLGPLLTFDGGFASTENGPRINSGLAALLIGAELSDDVGEDFPTDEDDARAIDQDNDGDPGVSIKAPIGRVFLGARAIVDFALQVDEDGTLLGTMSGQSFDISVYDDTVPFVNVEKKIRTALDPVVMIEQNHGVELHPGTADCAAAKAL